MPRKKEEKTKNNSKNKSKGKQPSLGNRAGKIVTNVGNAATEIAHKTLDKVEGLDVKKTAADIKNKAQQLRGGAPSDVGPTIPKDELYRRRIKRGIEGAKGFRKNPPSDVGPTISKEELYRRRLKRGLNSVTTGASNIAQQVRGGNTSEFGPTLPRDEAYRRKFQRGLQAAQQSANDGIDKYKEYKERKDIRGRAAQNRASGGGSPPNDPTARASTGGGQATAQDPKVRASAAGGAPPDDPPGGNQNNRRGFLGSARKLASRLNPFNSGGGNPPIDPPIDPTDTPETKTEKFRKFVNGENSSRVFKFVRFLGNVGFFKQYADAAASTYFDSDTNINRVVDNLADQYDIDIPLATNTIKFFGNLGDEFLDFFGINSQGPSGLGSDSTGPDWGECWAECYSKWQPRQLYRAWYGPNALGAGGIPQYPIGKPAKQHFR